MLGVGSEYFRNHTSEMNNLLFKDIKMLPDASEKLRKATISFFMRVCPSVRPSVGPNDTTGLPLFGFS